MIDTETETQTAHTTHQVNNPITFAFAVARLQQATIDCAYIFFDHSEPFINGQRRKKYKSRMQIVQEEREQMLGWLHSDDFHATCELIGQNSDMMNRALKKVMNMKENAMKVVDEYGLRIAKRVSIILFLLLLSLPATAQPFKPLQFSKVKADETVPEVVSLEKITQNPVSVKVNGHLESYKIAVYTYKLKNGKTCDLPVLIKGVKDNNVQKVPHQRHPASKTL
jgi:hypothetical protein